MNTPLVLRVPDVREGDLWMRRRMFWREYRLVLTMGNTTVSFSDSPSPGESWRREWIDQFNAWVRKAELVHRPAKQETPPAMSTHSQNDELRARHVKALQNFASAYDADSENGQALRAAIAALTPAAGEADMQQALRDAHAARLYNIPAAQALAGLLAPGYRLIYRDAFRWKDANGKVLSNHYDGQDIAYLAECFGYKVAADLGFAAVLHDESQTPAAVAGEAVDRERVAQLIAHRACCGTEHDPANGKLHGYCVVCGVDWPCEYAGKPPTTTAPVVAGEAVREALQKCHDALELFAGKAFDTPPWKELMDAYAAAQDALATAGATQGAGEAVRELIAADKELDEAAAFYETQAGYTKEGSERLREAKQRRARALAALATAGDSAVGDA